MAFPVFLDTCVLYGATLNDTLLRIAEQDVFRPHWSPHVMGELERNLAKRIGEQPARRRMRAMREAFGDAMVYGYDGLIPAMTCDEKDRHVLAAAVHSDCQAVVTFDVQDFPAISFEPYQLEVVHPDDFLLDQFDLHPTRVDAAWPPMSGSSRPHVTMDQVADALGRSGVPRFAAEVERKHLQHQRVGGACD